ncbi:hypothetical protein [Kitasatospora sp. NPDC057223]|uniref:hypothetical protein n=1 Tax=Kitasatospora sp. NPDC057223 TaxID=3346055 RepID=UPI00362A2B11
MTSEALRNVDGPDEAPPTSPCGWCGSPLPRASKGRPRTYCDLSCKSRAARRRIAERAEPSAPAGVLGGAVPLPPGVLAAAAEAEPPGPRRRVLEIADTLAGAAYYFARTVDDGDPARALTRLRGSVALFTAQLLEQAQAAHDDALATLSVHPDAHLDGRPAHLDGALANLGDPPISKRRCENEDPGNGPAEAGPGHASDAPDAHLDALAAHLDGAVANLGDPPVSKRRFESETPADGTTITATASAAGTAALPAAPGPERGPVNEPDLDGLFEDPPIPDRFVMRMTAAEVEQGQRDAYNPAALARFSPALLNRVDPPATATAAGPTAAQPARPTAHNSAQPLQRTAAVRVPAPPAPYERGFGDCDVLLKLPDLGEAWELAGWTENRLAYYVVYEGGIVGWVEIGIGAVPRWAAVTDGHFLTDPAGQPQFHPGPDLAAAAIRQARQAQRPR